MIDEAFESVKALTEAFLDNKRHYVDSGSYQEAEVRSDFIDKFFIALGWDVNHDHQRDPYRQEVKIEKPDLRRSGRADYAFSLAPFFRRTRFLVEAKRPQPNILSPDNCFQTIRYGWPQRTPICVLTDFNNLHILDTRYRPNINSAVSRVVKSWHCSEFADRSKFEEIYWLLAREAVEEDSIERFAADFLPVQQVAARQYELLPTETRDFDDDFLIKLDEWREQLAVSFKQADTDLSSNDLTEAVQRTLDRLIFIRFLEDKAIEEQPIISKFGGGSKSHWRDFTVASKRLDQIYNGTVFKPHPIIDHLKFSPTNVAFAEICDELTDEHSPYDFNSVPVEILGRIYERFLGKVVLAKQNRISIVQKEDVRKAGGVYYTPDYIVSYMVENSLGKLLKGKKPNDVLALSIIDTSCGSGSFLINVFGHLMSSLLATYRANPSRANKHQVVERDGELHLTMQHKREILLKCIYGVDIDRQAVEVAQLSLYLKLMEDETTYSAKHQQLEMGVALLPSLNANIVEGNSLVTLEDRGDDLFSVERLTELKSLDFRATFSDVFKTGGFDLVIGNPPYIKEFVNRNAFDHVRASPYYQGKMDIWYLFACRGIDWLKPKTGMLAFIATNNWVTNAGAKLLRKKVVQETRIEQLVDFGEFKVFRDASIQTMILIVQKDPQKKPYSFDYRRLEPKKATLAQAQALLEKAQNPGCQYLSPKMNPDRTPDGLLTFSDSGTEVLLDKIASKRNFVLSGDDEVAQGIVAPQDTLNAKGKARLGHDFSVGQGVFVLTKAEEIRLNLDESEKTLLRPYFTTNELHRYWGNPNNSMWIIYTDSSFKKRKKMAAYPKIKQYLDQFSKIITSHNKPYGLHRARDEQFFVGEKIMALRKCAEPSFTYTNFPCYVSQTFNIIKTNRVNNLFLTGLLNSRDLLPVMPPFMGRVCSGYAPQWGGLQSPLV